MSVLLDPARSGRGGRLARGLGRVKDGRTREQAEAELRAPAAALGEEHPATNTGRSVLVRPLAAAVAGDLRAPLLLLQGATVLILLIVCSTCRRRSRPRPPT